MPVESMTAVPEISTVIPAGGKARCMGRENRGLVKLHSRPLLDNLITGLHPPYDY